MAGLFDKQAEAYLDARPTYPAEWYSMLADRTSSHSLAWDVGTGNGQAAIGVSLPSFHFFSFIREMISRPKYMLNSMPKLTLQLLVGPFFHKSRKNLTQAGLSIVIR